MSILEVNNLTKKFGSFTAVDNISFTLEEGEILGFLGQNGAGKTTTIQMLLGVLNKTSGTIFYFGKSLEEHRTEILEKVNFSSTYTNLMWWLTVKENLTFMSYLYNIPDRKKRIAEIVEIFRLQEFFYKDLTELSAGQVTRVNLAKAFLNYPKVLLLDEPTASLDLEVAAYIRQFLLMQQEKFKTSIIITSHNMGEVEELCNRVIVIQQGKLVANDTPVELAASIPLSHIALIVQKGEKEALSYFTKKKLLHKKEGNTWYITLTTRGISAFLQDMTRQHIVYTDLNIQKPSLEDYFLQLAGERAYETS